MYMKHNYYRKVRMIEVGNEYFLFLGGSKDVHYYFGLVCKVLFLSFPNLHLSRLAPWVVEDLIVTFGSLNISTLE